MTPRRLPRHWILAGVSAALFAGVSPVFAQFPPPPGQSTATTRQDPAFPPPPAPANAPARQEPAFPPPPAPGQNAGVGSSFVRPSSGGFSAAPSGGFGAAPSGGGFAAAPPSGGFSAAPGGGPQNVPEAQRVCLTFPAIRSDVEKEFGLIKAASARKASREEACGLFKSAVIKEGRMLKFLETNKTTCGIPAQVITQVKSNHANTIRIRNQVCSNAPGPAAGPSLSDALGGPVIADDSTAKRGGGTFDTLTGNALQR
jgi:hypothetical protein